MAEMFAPDGHRIAAVLFEEADRVWRPFAVETLRSERAYGDSYDSSPPRKPRFARHSKKGRSRR